MFELKREGEIQKKLCSKKCWVAEDDVFRDSLVSATLVILNFLAGLQPRCLVSRIVAVSCVILAITPDLDLSV